MNDQKLNMKQTEQLLREHGFWLSASDIADGIEAGVYPFGRLVTRRRWLRSCGGS